MTKVLSVLLASAAALTVFGGLTACTPEDTNVDRKPDTITIWTSENSRGSKADDTGYESMIDGFKTQYPEYANFKYEFVSMGEGDVQGNMGNNPRAGAEVFFFASDHYGNMYHNQYLQPLLPDYAAKVKARDDKGVVDFVTENQNIYAFPATNDNGYFLWYDSSVLAETDVEDLDTLMAKAKEKKKQICFPYNNSWYSGSFLFGMGCKFNYTDNTLTHYKGDFNTPEAKAAGKAMLKYAQSENNTFKDDKNKDQKVIVSPESFAAGFADGTLCAAVSYVSSYTDIEKALKKSFPNNFEEKLNNIQATVLPKFTATLNGVEKTQHMGTFYGGKYCGVNATKSEEKIRASLALADWFTNEDGQKVRFEADGSGPSNTNVAQDAKVQESKGLVAYNRQIALEGVNCIQGVQSDAFWGDSGIKQFATGVFEQNAGFTTEAEIESKLDELARGLNF